MLNPTHVISKDADAARRIDGLQNRILLDPLFRGTYPADVVTDLAEITGFGHVLDGDLETIAAPLDFLGVNYYTPAVVEPGIVRPEISPFIGSESVRFIDRGLAKTSIGWEVDENGLLELLVQLTRDYPPLPIYITENGAAYDEPVHDEARIAYLDAHLRACEKAIDRGVPLQGYFAWSLLDNFEWAFGYSQRFGIVHVDYETQVRTPKDSAKWYAQRILREIVESEHTAR
ncbi:hypothetical protein GCM10022419_114560 [Nonomuraea rosea]|uniref:beta-glucosidase n=1 Tax=Nonomuraea rosea TaxID=638574 RepID=A0ABP6ZK96_9ACTN